MSEQAENQDQLSVAQKMINLLEKDDRYRVLRRVSLEDLPTDAPEPPFVEGIIIDTETTGKDPAKDKIIELSMIRFAYDPETGDVLSVMDTLTMLEDPGVPLDPVIVKLTGLTDQDVAGHTFDAEKVHRFVEGAKVIIAHGAGFDRKFVERRFPGTFESHNWACTHLDVDWEAEGIPSAKLDYIAFRVGFFYGAHRAMNDCVALFEILNAELPSKNDTVLKVAITNAAKDTIHLWAENAPYDAKDALKERGYRWNDGSDGRPKAWNKPIPEDDLAEEQAWLKKEVYGREVNIPMDRISAKTRYSERTGKEPRSQAKPRF
jgi:DNA polymerase-3 subunit epsilon